MCVCHWVSGQRLQGGGEAPFLARAQSLPAPCRGRVALFGETGRVGARGDRGAWAGPGLAPVLARPLSEVSGGLKGLQKW